MPIRIVTHNNSFTIAYCYQLCNNTFIVTCNISQGPSGMHRHFVGVHFQRAGVSVLQEFSPGRLRVRSMFFLQLLTKRVSQLFLCSIYLWPFPQNQICTTLTYNILYTNEWFTTDSVPRHMWTSRVLNSRHLVYLCICCR